MVASSVTSIDCDLLEAGVWFGFVLDIFSSIALGKESDVHKLFNVRLLLE